MNIDFIKQAKLGLKDLSGGDPAKAPSPKTVQGELLHYDILHTLQSTDAINQLTFQGGTSLRLIHGSERFSEDLDFTGGRDFKARDVAYIADILQKHIGDRYGMSVTIKEPKSLKPGQDDKPKRPGVAIDAWWISLETNAQDRSAPKLKVKLEIANIQSLTREVRTLKQNYSFLKGSYSGILVPAQSAQEVLQDKLVALPACVLDGRWRDRDIFDIAFLKSKGATPDVDMIASKLSDYNETDKYENALAACLDGLHERIETEFQTEMQRFLTVNNANRTVLSASWRQAVSDSVRETFEDVRSQIYTSGCKP